MCYSSVTYHMKVSVIIPAYNGEKCLERAVKSVLNQTFKDFEIIIVDDGSVDSTRNIVEKLIEEDNRIQYLYQKNSGGPASPLNTGIGVSKGEVIAFLEQDDEWLPEKLQKQINLLESEDNLSIVSCGALIKNDTSSKQRIFNFEKEISSEKWFKRMLENQSFFYNLSTLLIRKSAYKEVYFDENLKVVTDLDFYIRMMPMGFGAVGEPLVIYHSNKNSLSKGESSISTIARDFQYVFEKHKNIYESFTKARSLSFGYVGILFYCSNQRDEAWEYFKKSIKGYYFNFRLYFKIILLLVFKPTLYLEIRNIYFSYIKIK